MITIHMAMPHPHGSRAVNSIKTFELFIKDKTVGRFPLSVVNGKGYWRNGKSEFMIDIRSMPWPIETYDHDLRLDFMEEVATELCESYNEPVLMVTKTLLVSFNPPTPEHPTVKKTIQTIQT